ncbi:MAG: hypothetical protein SVM80_08060 [Halobacteriota archaeon]|nr:hypothetical protein [Halobacteriota archaeon]
MVLILIVTPFSAMVAGADTDNSDDTNGFMVDETTVRTMEASIDDSKHDFTFNEALTPEGSCSACHDPQSIQPYMWPRDLTDEEAYFTQTSNPNYVVSGTIYCYDCHDNHGAVDNDPSYIEFINASLGRYIPQDVAFDGNMYGNDLTYDSTDADEEYGYYESDESGHRIKSNPPGLDEIAKDDKLPCTDCHNPHNDEPTNEVFIKGSYGYPLGGKIVSNLKASDNTRSGTGTGREICTICHGYGDNGTSVRFVDVNPSYNSTTTIIKTPTGVPQHNSADSTPCTDCHTHNGIGASCGEGGCHGSMSKSHDTHSTAVFGPNMASCSGADGCHKGGHSGVFNDDLPKSSTTVCDDCHSPDGGYDGVDSTGDSVGAKDNWDNGVYDSNNTLLLGKEKWCVGCHDEEPATIDGVDAPKVGGDGSTYGYFINGHGADDKVPCEVCHKIETMHFDGEARTYSFNSTYYGPYQSGVAYASGYRLKYVNGSVPLMIPSNYGITWSYNAQAMRDNAFRLCLDCHDSTKIFDDTPGDGVDTNFKASDPDPPKKYSYAWGIGADTNEHVSHMMNYLGPFADSDWDLSTVGAGGSDGSGLDTNMACSNCHNVHGASPVFGSTNEAMIRNGELAGRTGYGFSYVIEDTTSGGYPMVTSSGANKSISVGSIFRNSTDDNMCGGSMCHGSPTPPTGSSYDARGSSYGTYLEYYRPYNLFEIWLTPPAITCDDLNGADELIDSSVTTANTLDTGTDQYVVFDLGGSYTIPSIKMYTDGNSYTWDVFMGNDTSGSCSSSPSWGTLVLNDWATPVVNDWTKAYLSTPTTAKYIKLLRSDTGGDLAANSLYEFMFDPPNANLTIDVDEETELHVYDPEGRHIGLNSETDEIDYEIPGADINTTTQTVFLTKLSVGDYKVILDGTENHEYELTVTGESEDGELINETFIGNITENEQHDSAVEVDTTDLDNILVSLEVPEETIVIEDGYEYNVIFDGLYPDIDNVEIDIYEVDVNNSTGMPLDIEVVSSCMVNSSGSGDFVLRFEDVQEADKIDFVYKINMAGEWIVLPWEIDGDDVIVTMQAGDPPIVFAEDTTQPTPTPTPSPDSSQQPMGGGGGGGGLPPSDNIETDSRGTVLSTYTKESSDGNTKLIIPEGTTALDSDGKALKSVGISSMRVGETVTAYNLGPVGATFDPEVELIIKYDSDEVAEGETAVIKIHDGAKWIPLETTVDTATSSASVKISHFTLFALFGEEEQASISTSTTMPAFPVVSMPESTSTTPTDVPEETEEQSPVIPWVWVIGTIIIIAAFLGLRAVNLKKDE